MQVKHRKFALFDQHLWVLSLTLSVMLFALFSSYPVKAENTTPVFALEPAADELPIDYYRSEANGDVWGNTPAQQLGTPPGKLPQDMWKFGLRSIYMAKYACLDSEVRKWMPQNIAAGIWYCTNPENRQQIGDLVRGLADRLETETNVRTRQRRDTTLVEKLEPAPDEIPIDYYRDEVTGDVWGTIPAWQLTPPAGKMPQTMWQYGLRSLYLAKYACWDNGVRQWMPDNIAMGVWYCTNPEERSQIAQNLRNVADRILDPDIPPPRPPPVVKYFSAPEPNSTLNLGSTLVGAAIEQKITIAETGNAELQVQLNSITGTHANEFKVIPDGFAVNIIDGGEAQTVTVQCTPLAEGSRHAKLDFQTNDPLLPIAGYSLECTGKTQAIVPPPIIAEPKYFSVPESNSTLNIGNGAVGTAIVQNISFAEIGNADLEFQLISISGTHANDFTINPDNGAFRLANDSGVTKTVSVQCTPSAEGLRKATLEFSTNDPALPIAGYFLECLGDVEKTEEVEIISPPIGSKYFSTPKPDSTLNLGSTLAGTSIKQNITISEIGDRDLTVDFWALSGTHANDFKIIDESQTIQDSFSFHLTDGGESRSVTVLCTPSTGQRYAKLEVKTNDPELPIAGYFLECTGTPEPIIEPRYFSTPTKDSTLSFTSNVGHSVEKSISIANIGNAALTVESFSLSGTDMGDFNVIGNFPLTVVDLNPQMVTVQCTPSQEGSRNAKVEFKTNDPSLPIVGHFLECTGISAPQPRYSSTPTKDSTLSFTSNVGSSAVESISIMNTGNTALIVEEPSLSGTDTGDFEVKGNFPLTVADLNPQMVTVQCTPSQEGSRNAKVEFKTNDPSLPIIGHFLECTGTVPPLPPLPNTPPIASSLSLQINSAINQLEQEIVLLGNDTEGDKLIYELLSPNSDVGYTSAYIEDFEGEPVLYVTIAEGFTGTIALQYRVTDGEFFSEAAVVTLQVIDDDSQQPVALGLSPVEPSVYAAFPAMNFGDQLDELPQRIDLSENGNFPTPGNQGGQGSCVGWATTYALKSYQERIEMGWSLDSNDHIFSPAFVYNQINGGQDNGAQIYDALNLIRDRGVATLATMPYDQYDFRTQPSSQAIQEAANFKIRPGWGKLNNRLDIKDALANRKPVVAGIHIYPPFNRLKGTNSVYNSYIGGVCNDGTDYCGGHAVTIVGYDDAKYGGAFKIINSWGTGWGDSGYFWLTYDFAESAPRGRKIMDQTYVTEDTDNPNTPLRCQADDVCDSNCPQPDPDCPVQQCQEDGFCDSSCPQDPDCSQPIVDFCQMNGLYGNGICDLNCPQPDPDCSDFCEIEQYYGDGVCDECPQLDPDCLCMANDGFCDLNCPQPDPDCFTPPPPPDFCEIEQYYDDGICDYDCPKPDPDCDYVDDNDIPSDLDWLDDLDDNIDDFVDDLINDIFNDMLFGSSPEANAGNSTQQFFVEHQFTRLSRFKVDERLVILGKTQSQDVLTDILALPQLANRNITEQKRVVINQVLTVQKLFIEGESGACYWLQNQSEIITEPTATTDNSIEYDFVYIDNCNSRQLVEDIVENLK